MAEREAKSTGPQLAIVIILVAGAIAFAFILATCPGENGKKHARTGRTSKPATWTGKKEEPQPRLEPDSRPTPLPEPAFEHTVSLSKREIAGLIDALLEAESFIENDYFRRTGRIAERLVRGGKSAWRGVCAALDRTRDEFSRSRLNAVLACMRWRFSPYTMFVLDSQNQFAVELHTRSVPPKGEWFADLQKLFDEKNAPGLIKSFTDKMDPDASYYIFDFLSKLGEQALEPLLEALLKEKHRYAAFCIRISLMRIAPRNLARLREYAADQKAEVRVAAVRALGFSGRKEAVPAIVRALGDESADVRHDAAVMLSLVPDRRAVSGLVKALKDEDEGVAAAAARALGIIGDPEAIKPLQEYFHSGRSSARSNGASALAGIGEQSAQVLMSFLKDPDEDIRVEAATAMSELRSPSTVPALLNALADKSPTVRTAAAGALAYIGGRGVPGALRDRLSDPDADVRTEAARALGRLRDEAATEALAAALEDPIVTVRLAAINALGRLGGRRALEILVGSLTNPELAPSAAPGIRRYGDSAGSALLVALPEMPVDTRHWAIALLAEAKVMDAVPILLEYLEHSDLNLRFCADKALRMITGHETSYKCDASEAERAKGAQEWRQWWEKQKKKGEEPE
jgi:HEAT repeat protein